MINKIRYIMLSLLLFTLSCQLSNDLMDGMDEYNTNADISISGSLATDAFYNNDKFTVVCTPSESGFTVKYTTDGTDPSRTSGTKYTSPITIESPAFTPVTIEIRAVAYDENRISGIVNTFVTVGDGLTVTTPFEIATPAHLENMSLKVNDGTHSNSYFKQIADIDLSTYNTGGGWVPIGIAAHPFSGNYDGGIYVSGSYTGSNYSINNMTIDRASSDNQGLFGYVAGNSILLHIYLSNADVTGSNNTGALAGYINGTGVTISFCHVTGSVTATVVSSVNIGGLAGYNTAKIYGSTSACAVTGLTSTNVGGFVGQNSGLNAQIYSNIATGEVKGGDYTGGFVGINTSGGVIDTWNSARGNVTGGDKTGGFLGSNDSSGVINQNNDARGDVIGADNVGGFSGSNSGTLGINNYSSSKVTGVNNVGGFTGYNTAALTSCNHIIGTVTGTGDNIGGLVGQNTTPGASILNSYSTGDVTGGSSAGGLVGYNFSGIISTGNYASGNVTGSTSIGGFIGKNNGPIGINNYATGNVNGVGSMGGFVGLNAQPITGCRYTGGTVAGTGNNIGGFAGYNYAALSDCYSKGTVTGVNNIGGFAGINTSASGIITRCYSDVTVNGNTSVGGLVGNNTIAAKIDSCCAKGSVTGVTIVGGLVGTNGGTTACEIRNSYARGNVTCSGLYSAGLIGENITNSVVIYCYSTGEVTSGSGLGLIGYVTAGGTYASLHWDTETSLKGTSAGLETGETTANMKSVVTFSSWDFILVTGDWIFSAGKNNDYPYLQWESL